MTLCVAFTIAIYDAAGRATSAIDALLHITTTNYDNANRKVALIDPLLEINTTVYDPASRATAAINPLGFVTTTAYDRANRTTAVTNAESETNTTLYDPAGRATAAIDALLHITTTNYDPANRKTAVMDANGNITTTAYDPAGRMTGSIDALLDITTTIYDRANRVTAVSDPNAHMTTTVFDAAGRAVAKIDALLDITTTLYDAANRATAVVDANVNTVTTVYDPAGRTTAHVDALGFRATSIYDRANRLTAGVDPLGHIATTLYDPAGRATSGIDPLLHITTSQYDPANRKTAVIDALLQIHSSVYDVHGRLTAAVDPLGHVTTTAYDRADRQTAVIDAELNITTTLYDPAARVTSNIDGNGHITTSVYDPANRKTAIIDANVHATTFVFNNANRKINEIDAEGGVITTLYDPAGNVTLALNQLGAGATHTYDAVNRLTGEQFTDAQRYTFTYDNVGNRLTQNSAAGLYTSTYDARNQLSTMTEPGGKVATYAYDAAIRRTAMNAYGKGNFTYTYDAANRQTSVTTPLGKTTTLVYDAINRVIERDFANGAVTTQSYDAAGNIAQIINTSPAVGLVSQLNYVYNLANQRTVQQESDNTVTLWSYDGKYQLTNELRYTIGSGSAPAWSTLTVAQWANLTVAQWAAMPVAPTSSGSTVSFNITHTYDPAGNRVQQNDGTTVTTYTYSPANRLTLANANGAITTYTNDAAGNRTAVLPPTSGNVYYTWDAPNHMATAEPAAGTITFTYNADGQRTAKQTTDGSTTGFLYDHKHLLQETDGIGGDITNTYATTTQAEYGDLLSEDGADATYQFDAQASTNAMLDPDGNIQAQFKYYAFGALAAYSIEGDAWTTLSVDQWADLTVDAWASLPIDIATNMTFVGQKQYYLDQDTDLYLLGGGNSSIYYDANTIRQTQDDPIRQARGDVNLGTYVGNNPINKIDPSGQKPDSNNAGVINELLNERFGPDNIKGTDPRDWRFANSFGQADMKLAMLEEAAAWLRQKVEQAKDPSAEASRLQALESYRQGLQGETGWDKSALSNADRDLAAIREAIVHPVERAPASPPTIVSPAANDSDAPPVAKDDPVGTGGLAGASENYPIDNLDAFIHAADYLARSNASGNERDELISTAEQRLTELYAELRRRHIEHGDKGQREKRYEAALQEYYDVILQRYNERHQYNLRNPAPPHVEHAEGEGYEAPRQSDDAGQGSAAPATAGGLSKPGPDALPRIIYDDILPPPRQMSAERARLEDWLDDFWEKHQPKFDFSFHFSIDGDGQKSGAGAPANSGGGPERQREAPLHVRRRLSRPRGYADGMSDEELKALVAYLSTPEGARLAGKIASVERAVAIGGALVLTVTFIAGESPVLGTIIVIGLTAFAVGAVIYEAGSTIIKDKYLTGMTGGQVTKDVIGRTTGLSTWWAGRYNENFADAAPLDLDNFQRGEAEGNGDFQILTIVVGGTTFAYRRFAAAPKVGLPELTGENSATAADRQLTQLLENNAEVRAIVRNPRAAALRDRRGMVYVPWLKGTPKKLPVPGEADFVGPLTEEQEAAKVEGRTAAEPAPEGGLSTAKATGSAQKTPPTNVPGLSRDRVIRFNRPGYQNYRLETNIGTKDQPIWKIFYHGYIAPGETAASIVRRHAGNIGPDELARFNPATDRIVMQPGTRLYGEARLMEHRAIVRDGTNVGRVDSSGTRRGNNQNGLQPDKLKEYEAWEKALNGQ